MESVLRCIMCKEVQWTMLASILFLDSRFNPMPFGCEWELGTELQQRSRTADKEFVDKKFWRTSVFPLKKAGYQTLGSIQQLKFNIEYTRTILMVYNKHFFPMGSKSKKKTTENNLFCGIFSEYLYKS